MRFSAQARSTATGPAADASAAASAGSPAGSSAAAWGAAGPGQRVSPGRPSPASVWGAGAAAPRPHVGAPAVRRRRPRQQHEPPSQADEHQGRASVPSQGRDPASQATITAGILAGQLPMPVLEPDRVTVGPHARRSGSAIIGCILRPYSGGSTPGNFRLWLVGRAVLVEVSVPQDWEYRGTFGWKYAQLFSGVTGGTGGSVPGPLEARRRIHKTISIGVDTKPTQPQRTAHTSQSMRYRIITNAARSLPIPITNFFGRSPIRAQVT